MDSAQTFAPDSRAILTDEGSGVRGGGDTSPPWIRWLVNEALGSGAEDVSIVGDAEDAYQPFEDAGFLRVHPRPPGVVPEADAVVVAAPGGPLCQSDVTSAYAMARRVVLLVNPVDEWPSRDLFVKGIRAPEHLDTLTIDVVDGGGGPLYVACGRPKR